MKWQRLSPGGFDAERVLGVWAFPLLLLASFLYVRVAPLITSPGCRFRRLTGIPCPTCGASRAFLQILDGRLLDAFFSQPLVVVLSLAYAGFALYAFGVVLGDLPRLRGIPLPRLRLLLPAAALLVLANWAYVVARDRAVRSGRSAGSCCEEDAGSEPFHPPPTHGEPHGFPGLRPSLPRRIAAPMRPR